MTEPCLTGTAATIAALLGVPAPEGADAPLEPVLRGAERAFGAPRADRVFLYNPDAVGSWLLRARAREFAAFRPDLTLPLQSVVPPVTPVCFASMYSGLQPEAHGIRRYEKPVLTVQTIFDTVPAAGKRAAIVSTAGDSISRIFLGRPVDYFIERSVARCNAVAAGLIARDEYDLIVLYNGDYDHWMHRSGPEGRPALHALRKNLAEFAALQAQIRACWQGRSAVLAFAPDHGCHPYLGLLGTHGSAIPADLEITHGYCFFPRKNP